MDGAGAADTGGAGAALEPAGSPAWAAVQDLVARWSDGLTRGDWAVLGATMAPGCVWEADPPIAIRLEGAEAIVAALREDVDAYEVLVQMAGGAVVRRVGPDRLVSTCTIAEVGRHGAGGEDVDQTGVYCDEVVSTDDGWRFASRRFSLLFSRPAPLAGTVARRRAEGVLAPPG